MSAAAPRKRARRGEGWIREIRPGVWKVTVSVRDADSGARRRSRTLVGSREEAEGAAASLQAEAGGPVLTLDVLVRAYLSTLDAEGRSRPTLRRYWQLWRDWLAPAVGRVDPIDLRRGDVADALAAMAGAGQSMSSIRQAATILNGCYQWAVDTGRAGVNPIIGAPLPDRTRITGARRRRP
jgi:hypothetical protein